MTISITSAIVASVLAGNTVCSDHFSTADRFQPTTVSEHQACVLLTTTEEQSGVHGSFVWVKTDENTIFSSPIKTVAQDKDGFKADVVKTIVKTVVEKEVIEVVTGDVAELNAKIADLEVEIAAKNTAIEALEATNADLKVKNQSLTDTINDLGAVVVKLAEQKQAYVSMVQELQGAVNTLHSELNVAEAELESAVAYIAQVEGALETVHANIAAATEYAMSEELDNWAYETGKEIASTLIVNGAKGVPYAIEGTGNTAAIIGIKVGGSKANNAMIVEFNSIVEDVANIAEAAYEAGFEDGYASGYAAGYTDGFQAGVDSVTQ